MNTFTSPNDSNPESVDKNVVGSHSSSPTISNPATAAPIAAPTTTAMTHSRGQHLAPSVRTNDGLKRSPPPSSLPAPKKQKCDHEQQWQQQSNEGIIVSQKQAKKQADHEKQLQSQKQAKKQATMAPPQVPILSTNALLPSESNLASKVKELQDEKAKLEATVQSLRARIRELESTSTNVELPAEDGTKRNLCTMRGVTKDQAIDIDREDYEAICKLFYHKMRRVFVIRDDDKERRVYHLRLQDRKIYENVPPEMIEDFFSIPDFVGRWNKLTHLSIFPVTHFRASLGLLTNLTHLNLCHSKMDSLPPAIGQLKNLQELVLYQSKSLSYLPQEIGDLSSLIKLDLSYTKIKSLPSSIGRLQNLKDLNLAETKFLSDLPEEIGNLSSLEHLVLRNTQRLSSLPREIGDLKSLKVLSLYESGVDISWQWPHPMGRLTNLQYLSLLLPVETQRQKKKQACEFLMKLALECPVLGHIDFPNIVKGEGKINYHTAWNRARWRMGFVTPKLWPLAIQRAKHAFDDYREMDEIDFYFNDQEFFDYEDCDIDYRYDSDDNSDDNDNSDDESLSRPSISREADDIYRHPSGRFRHSISLEDDIYRLLVCGRESFIEVLLDRNKKVAGTGT